MTGRPQSPGKEVLPQPWTKVLLALLPGLLTLIIEVADWRWAGDASPWLSAAPILGLCTVLCIGSVFVEHRLSAWCYPAMGLLMATVAFAAAPYLERLGLMNLHWILPVVLYLGPIVVGLILAKRDGIVAGLILVGSVYVIWEGIGDPEYALGMWTSNTLLVTVVSVFPQVFFLLLVPLSVLRAASMRSQLAGFWVPVGAGLAIAAIIGDLIRPYSSIVSTLMWDLLLVALPLLVMLGLLSTVFRREKAIDRAI